MKKENNKINNENLIQEYLELEVFINFINNFKNTPEEVKHFFRSFSFSDILFLISENKISENELKKFFERLLFNKNCPKKKVLYLIEKLVRYRIIDETEGIIVLSFHFNFLKYNNNFNSLIKELKLFYSRIKKFKNVPAYLFKYYENIDPVAYATAIEAGLKFDSCRVWGYSPNDIRKLWYAAGCRVSSKFRICLKLYKKLFDLKGRADYFYNNITPKKSLSANKTYYWAKGLLYAEKFRIALNYRQLIILGKLQYPFNFILVNLLKNEIKNNFDYNITSELFVQKLYELNNIIKNNNVIRHLTPYRSWWHRFNRVPQHIEPSNLINSALFSSSAVKSFINLCKKYNSELVSMQQPIQNLAVLFGDLNSIEQYCKKVSMNLHDAGQFILPVNNWQPQLWKPIILKNPALIKFSAYFSKVEEYCEENNSPLPKTIKDFENIVSNFAYSEVANYELAKCCYECNIEQESFIKYQDLYNPDNLKTSESIPFVSVLGSEVGLLGDWHLYKLSFNDPRGALLGIYTNCCQHLEGTAASCAKAGVKESSCGFYVVEYNGKIIAQSFAWRGTRGELVFDSIEALSDAYTEGIELLYKRATEKLLGKLMVRKVLVGTNSGIAGMFQGLETANKPAKQVVKTYSDAGSQLILGFAKNIPKIKIKKETEKKYDYDNDDMYYVCDYCEQEVNENETTCPHCGAQGI